MAASAVVPEQPLAGRVEADDAALRVDLQDQVGRAIDDGAELLPLALERLAQPRALERDRQLVAGQQGDPEAVRVERPAQPCGHRRQRRAVRSSPSVDGPRAPGRVAVQACSASTSGNSVGTGSPSGVAGIGDEGDGRVIRAADPERPAGGVREPDELEQAPNRRAPRASRRTRSAG